MKRFSCFLLSALLMAALTLPAAAVTKVRGYPGFADIPSTESPYFGPVKACYEAGLLNGVTDTAFEPQGNLSIAQLVVLAARLYNIQQGGSGTVPELPDLSQSYLRFRSEDGGIIASYSLEDVVPTFNGGAHPYISLSPEENNPALPETCRLEIGFEGYNHLRSYTGTRQSFHSEPGCMTEGFEGTGYSFTDMDAGTVFWYQHQFWYMSRNSADLRSAWWFPAAFYLASEGCFNLSGDLIDRANPEHKEDYDPLTGFSAPASRAFFAWLVDAVTGELPVLNEAVSIPDVTEETPDADAILRLYRAGVLTGVDAEGSFKGSAPLTRGQAAILLSRVIEPTARKGGA